MSLAPADAPGTSAIVPSADGPLLRIEGAWTLPHYRELVARVAALREHAGDIAAVDASGLSGLDTAGAGLLCALLGDEQLETLLAAQAPERQALLRTVREAQQRTDPDARAPDRYMPGDILEHIGRTTLAFRDHLVGVCGLLGLTLETFARTLFRPGRWRVTPFLAHLERTGLDAVPIVALLTFLVGAVVAFLGATVLTTFGASVYTIDCLLYTSDAADE